jgi:polyribonucleotide nucleotidyltransferase
MVGHGSLAERALWPVFPALPGSSRARSSSSSGSFPYVVRLTSETTSSDGSSSMAAVCGGSLALMDAGVPLAAPVAGIAMGVVVDRSRSGGSDGGGGGGGGSGDHNNLDTDDPTPRYRLLTDICALEDHFGDMDFKIAGTAHGITAAQMDCHAPVRRCVIGLCVCACVGLCV